MSEEQQNREKFNRAIQTKLNDNNWDELMVQKVIHAQKENRKRWIQYTVLPAIFLVATSIFYINEGYSNATPKFANKSKNQTHTPNFSKDSTRERNHNFQLHMIDVVFNKLQ